MNKSTYNYAMRVDGRCDIIEERPIVRVERITVGEARDEHTAIAVVSALNKAENPLVVVSDDNDCPPNKPVDYYERRDNERVRAAIRNFVKRNEVEEFPGKTGLNAIQKAWDDMVCRIRYRAAFLQNTIDMQKAHIAELNGRIERYAKKLVDQERRICEQDKLILEMRKLIEQAASTGSTGTS